ncbi:hypothetical protein DERP_009778 [Dermatophagoides pteronyssinus]|uniref:Uncharacterized protein n=1 Tax=Dermatophagoides pteronyssinus TaxID=6956 RepID=A0ABQ8IRH8_DERPT|nr:hypothetical protein DERP_009778 [Dermatophagoides pteronyssinus]
MDKQQQQQQPQTITNENEQSMNRPPSPLSFWDGTIHKRRMIIIFKKNRTMKNFHLRFNAEFFLNLHFRIMIMMVNGPSYLHNFH